MMRAIGLAAVAVLISAETPVRGQDAGQDPRDVTQGRVFAERVCAGCHGIQLGQPSAVAGAPNFYTIAMTPGMSPIALRVVLETPHHSMPNFPFSDEERRTVIAYILSLRPNEKR
jgi:mono/diheme cytochrome c family protein